MACGAIKIYQIISTKRADQFMNIYEHLLSHYHYAKWYGRHIFLAFRVLAMELHNTNSKSNIANSVRQNITNAKLCHIECKEIKNFKLLVMPCSDEAFNT